MNNKIIFERLIDSAIIPQRANENDSGMDFFSPVDFEIAPKSDFLLPLGLKVKLPVGMDLVFENKSGRATKNKLIRGACVVDEGYRGEIHAHFFNLGRKKVFIKAGEKIIQGIIRRVEYPEIVEGIITDVTSRGKGGFGSTGLAYHQVINPTYVDPATINEESSNTQLDSQHYNELGDEIDDQNLFSLSLTKNDESNNSENRIEHLEKTINKLENIINTLVEKGDVSLKKQIPPHWYGGIKVNHS